MSVNKVILIGRLGADPELKYAKNQVPVCTFSLATTQTWQGKDGVKNERTDWHRIIAFGNLAKIAAEYMTKGKMVYVEGSLQTNQYIDKNQIKHTIYEVRAITIDFLERTKEKTPSLAEIRKGLDEDEQGQFHLTTDDIPF